MNYLITGGKGFIGSHLANRIIQYKKNKVFVLDNLSNPCNNFLNNQIKCFYGDVSDFEFLKKLLLSLGLILFIICPQRSMSHNLRNIHLMILKIQ